MTVHLIVQGQGEPDLREVARATGEPGLLARPGESHEDQQHGPADHH
jgi:hypothetical protein